MDFSKQKTPSSHGTGGYKTSDFRYYGRGVVIENGVLIFHPENISIFDKVYVGHNTILKGYFQEHMVIGEGTWIGQNCFIHSAGGIVIGKAVGIGPGVKILTSYHQDLEIELPVMFNPLAYGKVEIMDGADIGIGAILLPNITIGEGSIIGAGSLVNSDVDPYSVYAGTPARFIRKRNGK